MTTGEVSSTSADREKAKIAPEWKDCERGEENLPSSGCSVVLVLCTPPKVVGVAKYQEEQNGHSHK